MNSERREAIRRWRDATLFKTYGNEGAASRLAGAGELAASVKAALAIDPPTDEELRWADVTGEPLSPWHPWWGHQGPSAIELRARREGLPWPPEAADEE